MTTAARLAVLLLLPALAMAQANRIDAITPMAPELAQPGPLPVGVRTLTAVDRDRVDVLGTTEGATTVRADRTFTIEVWYPAALPPGAAQGGEYRTVTRDPSRAVVLLGRAVRDAAPAPARSGHPLVIISHGYPGNRFLMSHLGEHLASRGFVVASVDHPDSTYADQKAFASTLYNRPFDQVFVLDEIDRLARPGSGSFLAGMADVSRTAIIGYSMGGYGLLNVLGAGFSDASVTAPGAPPNRLLQERAASNPAFARRADPRIKAAVAIAPWGLPARAWQVDAFRAITTPTLFVAGSADDVSGYATGTRAIFEAATGADRFLLTFLGAGHNAGAPIPAPAESFAYSDALKLFPFMHYADAVWDTVRMNNILQHFVAAFLALQLKDDREAGTFLDLVPKGSDALYSVERDGTPKSDYTYWKGFKQRTAAGLAFERLRRSESAAPAAAPLPPRPVAGLPMPAFAPRASTEGDDRDIRRLAMRFEAAWASHDAKRIGELWLDDGNMIHPDGLVERGPGQIERNRASMLAQKRYAMSLHPLTVSMVTFRGPGVAVVDGQWEMTRLRTDSGGSAPPVGGLFTWVVRHESGEWKIAAWRYTLDAASMAVAR
jgi:uncharacterized protein (TIGR02246 family)